MVRFFCHSELNWLCLHDLKLEGLVKFRKNHCADYLDEMQKKTPQKFANVMEAARVEGKRLRTQTPNASELRKVTQEQKTKKRNIAVQQESVRETKRQKRNNDYLTSHIYDTYASIPKNATLVQLTNEIYWHKHCKGKKVTSGFFQNLKIKIPILIRLCFSEKSSKNSIRRIKNIYR